MQQNTALAQEFFSDRDVARLLGFKSPHTLRGWRRRGLGPPCHRLGKVVRYRLPEVERWLASRKEEMCR